MCEVRIFSCIMVLVSLMDVVGYKPIIYWINAPQPFSRKEEFAKVGVEIFENVSTKIIKFILVDGPLR